MNLYERASTSTCRIKPELGSGTVKLRLNLVLHSLHSKESKMNDTNVICSLMLDGIYIKKHVSWDGIKFLGYVDIGSDNNDDDDSSPVAKDALVFMVVSVNSYWKISIAYLFIDGLSGAERANLVKVA